MRAFRGKTAFSDEKLRSHLRSLLRLDNVGVLLGSGASAGGLGGLTMKQLWVKFVERRPQSLQWLQVNAFLPSDRAFIPNIEDLSDTLEIARAEWTRSGHTQTRELATVIADVQREVISAARLNEGCWSNPEQIINQPAELANHIAMLRKLCGSRQPAQPAPWVFTTNYDLAPEWAAEAIGLKYINGFDGLHYRAFAPHNFDLGYRNVLARGEARFGTYNFYLAKLHGSLTWLRRGDEIVEAPSQVINSQITQFIGGQSNVAPALVFPTGAKYQQTVGFLLGELFRRFTEFLSRPHTCIITCGYSFSDAHINRLLLTALQNPTLQLVIYAPETSVSGETLDSSGAAQWVQRLASLYLGQVTIVGGKEAAYFDRFSTDLPDPAVFDEDSEEARKSLQTLAREFRGNDAP